METATIINTNELTDVLNWRYATKKFDPEKKLSDIQIETLMESLRLAPSSMGLQPYTFVRVTKVEVRHALRKVSSNQAQITDASDILVFAAHKAITEQDIRNFVKKGAMLRGYPDDSVEPRVSSVKRQVEKYSREELLEWNSRQAYIAMGQLLAAAALLKIDACPMEGIDKSAYNRILDLNSLNLQALAVVALGFRSVDDALQFHPKVRKSHKELFLTI